MKQILRMLRSIWGNASVRKKLIAFTIMLVLIPSVIFSVVFALFSIRNVENNYQNYVNNVMEQTAQNVGNRVDNITYMLYDLSTDKSLEENIKKWSQKGLAENERYILRQDITKTITRAMTKIEQVHGVYLSFDRAEPIQVSMSRVRYTQIPDISEIRAGKGSNIWYPFETDNQVVPVSKALFDFVSLQPIAYMTVFVKIEYFTDCLDGVLLGDNGRVYLLEGNGRSIGDKLPQNVLEEYTEANLANPGWRIWVPDSYHQLAMYPMETGQWNLLGVVDMHEQQKEIQTILLEVVGVFLLVACILIWLCVQVSKSISRPIKDLQDCMERFSAGDFQVIAPAKYNDEIGELRCHFNKMAQEVDRLISRVYVEENLRQKAQIEALQMQINPHFLYNTLDTINWMSETHGQRDIAVVSRSLASLMRYSLRDDEFVAVEEELEAVENYIKIQHYRYGDSLKLELDIHEEVLYENMPKHILLPLLENALEHGLKNIKGEKRITVHGTITDNVIHIHVQDNGEGFPNEEIAKILEVPQKTDGRHMRIGLRNVNQRLQLIYGKEYGLSIASKPQSGSTVMVSFPVE